MKKIILTLEESDIEQIEVFMKEKRTKREMIRAQALLLLHKRKREKDIAEFLGTDYKTVWRTKKAFLNDWLMSALQDAPRSGQPRKYTQAHETELVAIACSDAPEGRAKWTLELLVEEMKKKGCKTMNRETVRLTLKKTNVSLG